MKADDLRGDINIAANQYTRERDFWLNQLSGELPGSNFPYVFKKTEASERKKKKETFSFNIDGDIFAKLVKLSGNSDSRLFLVLLTGLFILMHKYTGGKDLIVGAPVYKQEVEGDFINTILTLRNRVAENITFKEFLLQVRGGFGRALENQNYPLQTLLYQLNIPYSKNDHFPLFDAAILLENIQDRKYLRGINLNIIFSFVKREDGLKGVVEYNGLLYDKETAERMISHYREQFRKIFMNLDIPLSCIDLLSDEDRRRLLYDFNDTAAGYPEEKGAHELFAEQAGRTPDNTAIAGPSLRVSYRELNEKSNRLAHMLRQKRVEPGTIVGITAAPSPGAIVGILGILKAGGAYLPIEPGCPGERKKFIIQDSGLTLLLTGKPLSAEIGGKETREPGVIHRPGNLAYIIYTSGTTGVPKGVMMDHRGLVNYAWWAKKNYIENETPGFPFFTSLSFDLTVTSIFCPLVAGKTVFIYKEDEDKDAAIEKVIEEDTAGVVKLTPSHLKLLRDVGGLDRRFLNIKRFVVGGEKFTAALAAEVYEKTAGTVEIYNEYGPTEAAVGCMIYRFGAGKNPWDSVPVGKPAANTKIYLLDADKKPVPLGVAGELFISGAGLARGYLNRVEATHEKFAANPFVASGRLYRTGDLARWLPGNDIEFLDRIDNQVKIRGFRVELAEIETLLLKREEVRDAVVRVMADESGEEYLCAYMVLAKEVDTAGLRKHMTGYLPEYMIPSYFMPLEEIPLTTNGKVDLKALPLPGESPAGDYVPPKNEVEESLSQIWADVLARDRIGTNENFFMIGGDSIKAIQISARMNSKGYKVRLRDIFQNPSITELAAILEKSAVVSDQSAVTGSVPLTPIQHWFFQEKHIQRRHFNQAVMLYSAEGFEEEGIRVVFAKIQEHHDALRMIYKEENGTIIQEVQGVDFPLSLEIHDLAKYENPREILENKAQKIQESIHLEKGPLMKLGLFYLADGHRLLIVIHHLVIDGVSWRILLEDFETLYRQYKKGEKLALPAKSDSFKLWSEKLSSLAGSEGFLKEKAYWSELDAAEVPVIKKDLADEDNFINDAETLSFALIPEKTDMLLTKTNQPFGTEINDILLIALGLAIKKTRGNNRVSISLEGHGREDIVDADVGRTVGWFTAVFPVVLDFHYEEQYGLSRQIKEAKEALRRIPNKGIGYGILRYLTPGRQKKEMEFKLKPRVSFNYLGQFDADVGRKTFTIARESPGNPVSLQGKREYDLEITGMITDKRLTISISYNKKHFKRENIETLGENFHGELGRLIEYCAAKKERELTPSDFTHKELPVETVDDLAGKYAIENLYQLTPLQEGILFHAGFEDSTSVYFEQIAFQLHGDLDVKRVERALKELYRRHDILRTAFISEGLNYPIQLVLKDRTCDFYYEDIHRMTRPEDKEAYIEEFKVRDRKRYFDLSKDVLMRVSVLRSGPAAYHLVWSFQHILMDGWCIGVLISEFFEIYSSYLENRPYRLPEAAPYRNFLEWLEKQDREASLSYWRRYLEGYDEGAALPKTGTLQDSAKYKNEEVTAELERGKTSGLVRLAGKNRVTLNTIVQAVWGIILARSCGLSDAVFGAVVSGRSSEIPGVENIIGLFINTVPVRIAWNRETTFKQLIKEVQEKALESEPHHYFSLAEIQAASALKKGLFDCILAFENYPVTQQINELTDKDKTPKGEVPGQPITISDAKVFEQSNYDLNFLVYPLEKLRLLFRYNGNLYEKEFIGKLAGLYLRVIRRFLDNEELKVDGLDLLSEEEKKRILYDFNNTDRQYPGDSTIHALFERQAAKTPGNIAVSGQTAPGGGSNEKPRLTYDQLNRKANQLARLLKGRGVKRGTIVAIMSEPSLDLIVGILGVLKAGGAYLPTAPDYPELRIRFILRDSQAAFMLTHKQWLDKKHSIQRDILAGNIVLLDDETVYTGRAANPLECSGPGCPAYLIYTSGTTGRPKGVIVEHRGLVNYIYWAASIYVRNRKIDFPLYTSISFDLTVTSLFTPLITGSTVVVYAAEEKEFVIREIFRQHTGAVKLTPSHLKLVKESYLPGKPANIQCLILGGEELDAGLAAAVDELFKGKVEIYNEYGPTEATVGCMIYRFRPGKDRRPTVPIGVPAANMRIYLLDKNLAPVVEGTAGEICIAGDGLARGYLNRPEISREKFIHPSPFTLHSSPIYKTGDLGRRLPDGNIEFLGRNDQQLKIRGFRIEVAEIESQLLNYNEINEVIVIPRDDENREKCLWVYFVSPKKPDITELKNRLANTLPPYMMPSFFVQLEKIPLTPNGKVDRGALAGYKIEEEKHYIAPRNYTERKLIEIYVRELRIDEKTLSIDSDIFELGAHSLTVNRIVAGLHKEFDIRVPMRVMFEDSTIKHLARYIKEAVKEKYAAVEPTEEKEYYELSSAQKRLYILQQLAKGAAGYNIFFVLEMEGILDKEGLEGAFNRLINRHESLRTSFIMVDEEPVQRIHENVGFEIEYFDLTTAIHQFVRPFDLARGPMLRAGLIKTGEQKHIFMLDMHHIITDGISTEIFIQESLALYAGEQLMELKLRYKDYAGWQNRLLNSKAVDEEERFWLEMFAGKIPGLNLPLDFERPALQSYQGNSAGGVIGARAAKSLKALAAEHGATLNMILLALYNLLLSKFTDQEDIVVGISESGRFHHDLEHIIGMFVNMLPLRNYPSYKKRFIDFLAEVKECSINAFDNKVYQFDTLVEKLKLTRSRNRHPLFDAAFLFGTDDPAVPGRVPEVEISDLCIKPYKDSDKPISANFDIELITSEFGDTISFQLVYCSKLFKKSTIEKMCAAFHRIVEQVIENPRRKLYEINILDHDQAIEGPRKKVTLNF